MINELKEQQCLLLMKKYAGTITPLESYRLQKIQQLLKSYDKK